jgi:hypothetical protein
VLTSTELALMEALTDLIYRIERNPQAYELLKYEWACAVKLVAGIDAAVGARADR